MILWVEIVLAAIGWLSLSILIGVVVGRIARSESPEPLGFDPFVGSNGDDDAAHHERMARAAEAAVAAAERRSS